MIEGFKQKLNSMLHPCVTLVLYKSSSCLPLFLTRNLDADESTTPPGSPPRNILTPLNNGRPNPAPPVVPASIMETLAKIASANKPNHTASAPAAAAAPAPAPAPVSTTPYTNPGAAGNVPSLSFLNHIQPGVPFIPTTQASAPPVNASALSFMTPQSHAPAMPNYGTQNGTASLTNGMPAAPPSAPAGGADPTALQVALIQQLIQNGLPADQIAAVVKALAGNNAPAPAAAPQANQGAYPMAAAGNGNGWAPPRTDDRDLRSPTSRARGRSRSRSPGRHWDRDSPRGERRFGDFGRNSPTRDRFDDRDRGRPYRQRSPAGRRGSSARHSEAPPPPDQKFLQFDPSLPQNHIRVLSRTLFVGGVTCPENELRNIFGRFGAVQTCIVNKEKRHAFVKMYTRKDAVSAKEAMEEGRSGDASLRTRWGVGFGPRDCSDYATGVSVIPIHKLTEADRKWMLTAPYGGSGGKPIQHGLVVEEPDIEIGAGVSSKAISRRMQTDKGGSHGPKSSHHREDDNRNDRRGGRRGGGRDQGHRRDEDRPAPSQNNVVDPSVPAFPFGITTDQNGMPVFPPGFVFPAPDATSNPPY